MAPDNAGYFYAAYVLAAFVYVGYAVLLVRRRARARRALQGLQARTLAPHTLGDGGRAG